METKVAQVKAFIVRSSPVSPVRTLSGEESMIAVSFLSVRAP
jgi:hypothetical protein